MFLLDRFEGGLRWYSVAMTAGNVMHRTDLECGVGAMDMKASKGAIHIMALKLVLVF